MAVSRRKLLRSMALAGTASTVAKGQDGTASIDALRNVADAHGVALSQERLGVLQPVLERRQSRLLFLREYPIGDQVGPTPGILRY